MASTCSWCLNEPTTRQYGRTSSLPPAGRHPKTLSPTRNPAIPLPPLHHPCTHLRLHHQGRAAQTHPSLSRSHRQTLRQHRNHSRRAPRPHYSRSSITRPFRAQNLPSPSRFSPRSSDAPSRPHIPRRRTEGTLCCTSPISATAWRCSFAQTRSCGAQRRCGGT